MKKFNFLNEYFKNRASDENAATLLNMFLEEDANNGKNKIIAYPTPGKITFNTDSGSVGRGGIEHNGVAYFVVDNIFYTYDSSGTRTSKGTLNSSTGRIRFAAISNQIMFIDGADGYHYNTTTATFTTISDPDFPANPYTITAQDATFLISDANTAIVYGSDVADGTSWNALSFNTKEGHGDTVNGLISNKGLVYVLGQYESDIWYNNGASTFSFAPVGLGGKFNYGTASPDSVAKGQDSILFLGQSRTGGKCVIMMDQYNPKVISNRAIDYQINQLTTWSDAFGYCYLHNGHEFYVLTFPTDGVTFMYDLTTKLWTELQSYVGSSYTRDISNCYVYCYNKHLVGSYNSGTIYELSSGTYTENGIAIKRQLVSPPGYGDGAKTFLNKLQIDCQTGVGSSLSVVVDVSKNSGQTYTTTLTKDIPSAGGRLLFHRLGMTQNAFVIRLTFTSNGNFIVLGVLGDFQIGMH